MEHDAPVANISLDINFGLQTHMQFNGSDASLLVSNNNEQIILYQWVRWISNKVTQTWQYH